MRGEIYDRERAAQIRNFSGLRWQNITPTDVDGLIEYHNKCYIFIEAKFGTGEVPFGQKLALTRLVDNLRKPAVLFVAAHQTPPGQDIDMKTTLVSDFYFRRRWRSQDPVYLKDMIDRFIKKYGKENSE
jgi:hypothetical protein